MISFFRNLFGKKSQMVPDIKTAPLTDEQLRSVTRQPVVCRPPQLIVGSAQSSGMQRDHNEDTLFTLSSVLSDGNTELPFGFLIVADGMGGHIHGEIASGVAVRAMSEYIIGKLYPSLMGLHSDLQNESIQEIMENGIKEAQQAVLRRAPGGGTTLTAALIIGEQVTLAHVGDSRAYFIYPDGRIQTMTQDHSLVRRLVELGQMTEQDAAISNQRNVLYRAIGQNEPFRPDISTFLFPRPGYIMLCSDGLWGVVAEQEIFKTVTSSVNLSMACSQLIEKANQAGGPDNISAVMAHYLN